MAASSVVLHLASNLCLVLLTIFRDIRTETILMRNVQNTSAAAFFAEWRLFGNNRSLYSYCITPVSAV